MRFKGLNTTALVFVALFSSSLAVAKGKGAPSKAAKECTDKGGTWEKKKKKCDMAKTEETVSAPAAGTTPADHKEETAEPAPAE